MRLALFADGEVGLSITRMIINDFFDDLAVVVVTQEGVVSRIANEAGVAVCLFSCEDDLIKRLPDNLDLGLLAWWPKIISERLLRVPKMGFINTHPSLLPFNKGKHYNFWALVEQAPFGVTLHRVDAGIDTGHIVAQKKISYDWTDTGGTLYRKAQAAMLDLFSETWPTIRNGNIPSTPQVAGDGSFHRANELAIASRINLDGIYRGRDLINLLRARTFPPHPGCWFEDNGQYYEIQIEIRKINNEPVRKI